MKERVYLFLPTGIKFYLDLEDLGEDDFFVDMEFQPEGFEEAFYVKRFLSALSQASGTSC